MKPTRITRWTATAAAGAVLAIVPLAAASAAPVTSVTAHTHVLNRPDGGHGGTWAYDTFTRTLTVTQNADQSSAPAGDTLYTATIADHGTFSTVGGALAPNQSTAGVKVTHNGTKGSINGTYTLAVTAPTADGLTGTVPTAENDNFGTPVVTTGDWPKQAFATATGVSVNGGAYSWVYKTGCETWTDSSTNGDGNLAADGNITGAHCTPPPEVHYAIQAVGRVHSLQSHKYLADVHGKLVQEDLSSAGWFAMVLNLSTNTTGLEVLTSHHGLSGEFVTIPDSGQATVGHHFVRTEKHGSYYTNADGNVLNNAAYSLANGNRQIGWAQVHSLNEQYTSPGQ